MNIKPVHIIILISIIIFSCERLVRPENDRTISTFDEDESHHFGENCMDCHYSAGRGEGWFSVGGSVGGNTKQAIVELINSAGDIKKVEVDQLGNFYTTESIDFTGGLKVGIREKSGEIEYMDDKIKTGQCNLCHGSITEALDI